MAKKLVRIIVTGIGLFGLIASSVGCSGFSHGRFYVGTWPIGSDLSYEQKKELMERENEAIEAEARNFPYREYGEITPVPLIRYKF